jgi:hypothetical protein
LAYNVPADGSGGFSIRKPIIADALCLMIPSSHVWSTSTFAAMAVATWMASACLIASRRVRSWAFSAMVRSTARSAMYSCSKNASSCATRHRPPAARWAARRTP